MTKQFLPKLVHNHEQHRLVIASCVALGMLIIIALLYWLSVSMGSGTNIAPPATDTRAQMLNQAISKLTGAPAATPEQRQTAISKLKVKK